MLDLYLMSPPSPRWTLRGRANFRSREAPPVDAARARREWLALAEAIEAHGGTVVALSPAEDALTGMPYAAECGHIVDIGNDGDAAPLFPLPVTERKSFAVASVMPRSSAPPTIAAASGCSLPRSSVAARRCSSVGD